jgi:hypothetical protein
VNPVTQALLSQVPNRRVARFVRRWDALEALVVRVYRAGTATGGDEAAYSRTRRWLLKRYPGWRAALTPYWQRTTVGGEPAREDPFAKLLAAAQAHDFVDNWAAMQTLPAAREALNEWLAAMIEK